MNLQSCRRGDLVELKGDPVSCWLVTVTPSNGHLEIQLRGRDLTRRQVSSRDVSGLWRRAGKRS